MSEQVDRPACELRIFVGRNGELKVGLTDSTGAHRPARIVGGVVRSRLLSMLRVLGGHVDAFRLDAATNTHESERKP